MNDSKQRSDFLDVCYKYDSNQYVCGIRLLTSQVSKNLIEQRGI